MKTTEENRTMNPGDRREPGRRLYGAFAGRKDTDCIGKREIL